MSEPYKQKIDDDSIKQLESALSEFIKKHAAGNPGLQSQIESAEGSIRAALEAVDDHGSAVVGAAIAFLAFIRSSSGRRMRITRPYPKE